MFSFSQKNSAKYSSLDKKKTVSTTLPKFSRPVVRKVLDQGPEPSQTYEAFQNVIFTPNFFPRRRIHFLRPCRKFLSQRLIFFYLIRFSWIVFDTELFLSTGRVQFQRTFAFFFSLENSKIPAHVQKKTSGIKSHVRKNTSISILCTRRRQFLEPCQKFCIKGWGKIINFKIFGKSFNTKLFLSTHRVQFQQSCALFFAREL